ncbi:MAG: hypothetical protein IIU77_03075 [Clostridia bacterium]|nr:hypothetical protein [Clostridia bacterium]
MHLVEKVEHIGNPLFSWRRIRVGKTSVKIVYRELVVKYRAYKVRGYPFYDIENGSRKTLGRNTAPLIASEKTLVFINAVVKTDLALVFLSVFILTPSGNDTFVFF